KVTPAIVYDKERGIIKGTITIECWLKGNSAGVNDIMKNTPADEKMVFNVEKIIEWDLAGGRRALTAEEKFQVIKKFMAKVQMGMTEQPNQDSRSPLRGRVKLEATLRPNLLTLDGLFMIDNKPQFIHPSG